MEQSPAAAPSDFNDWHACRTAAGNSHDFAKDKESLEVGKVRETRLDAIQQGSVHVWSGHKEHAWLKEELAPVSGASRNVFGSWVAALVDTLDTL